MSDNLGGVLSLKDRGLIEKMLSEPASCHEYWDALLSGCKIRDYMLKLGYNQVTIYAEGGMAFQNVKE